MEVHPVLLHSVEMLGKGVALQFFIDNCFLVIIIGQDQSLLKHPSPWQLFSFTVDGEEHANVVAFP